MTHTIKITAIPGGRWRVTCDSKSEEGEQLTELLAEVAATLTVKRRIRERVELNRKMRAGPK